MQRCSRCARSTWCNQQIGVHARGGKAQSVLFTALNPAQHADKRKLAEQRDERVQCCALLDASLTVKQRSLANVDTPLCGMSG